MSLSKLLLLAWLLLCTADWRGFEQVQQRWATQQLLNASHRLNVSSAIWREAANQLRWGEMDVVISWFNASDPAWIRNFTSYGYEYNPLRYMGSIEIELNLLTLSLYASWVRNVFVTAPAGQSFNCSTFLSYQFSRKVKFISHAEFIPAKYLPSFHSDAIESFIYNIPGLSPVYMYLNDDFIITRKMKIDRFINMREKRVMIPHGRKAVDYCSDNRYVHDHSQVYHNTVEMFKSIFGTCYSFTSKNHVPYIQLKAINKISWDIFESYFEVQASYRVRNNIHASNRHVEYYYNLDNFGTVNTLMLASLICRYVDVCSFDEAYKNIFFSIVDGKEDYNSLDLIFQRHEVDSIVVQDLYNFKNLSLHCPILIHEIILAAEGSRDKKDLALNVCNSLK
jgi:hypothetical protein